MTENLTKMGHFIIVFFIFWRAFIFLQRHFIGSLQSHFIYIFICIGVIREVFIRTRC